ncbi:MAG: NUDIX hydrolase [Lachnospiraceae bacterium]|nr:NUDIX hydrolase [Lachnospiraceae bacterium]
MNSLFVHIKAVVRIKDSYLVLRHWVDDRIVDPYSWEFVDTDLEEGESPQQAALRAIREATGHDGEILRPLYTWTNMLGDRQCVGIAFLATLSDENPSLRIGEEFCGHEWITVDQFEDYIDNKNVIKDLKKALELDGKL